MPPWQWVKAMMKYVFKARYWLLFAVDEGAFEHYCSGSI
jgi:hypothetical protein